MSKAMIFWHVAAIALIVVLGAWWGRDLLATGKVDTSYPTRPIHVVVPYAAGGGSDTFVRIVQQGIEEDGQLGQPLVIINQAGGIGTIGSREVKNAEPDGYKILCHHNAIITAKLAGTVPYGPEAFEPIALTGDMSMVILVRADSPHQDVTDLLKAAKESPREVRFGANKGAPAYFTTLQLEDALPGAEFSIVSSGGGADRYSKIIGGHLQAGIFSLSEYLDFRAVEGTAPNQDIRAIAVLSDQRHESIPDVPTTVEKGVDVVLRNSNYWWAPIGTPQETLEKLAAVLESAMKNAKVRAELERLRMDPDFDSGESFRQRLQVTVDQFEDVVAEKPASLPSFPKYVAAILLLLSVWVVSERWREAATRQPSKVDKPQLAANEQERNSEAGVVVPAANDYEPRPATAIACFFVLAAYVLLLGAELLPYAVATALMIVVIGGLMLRHATGRWWVLLELALLTGLGTQFVFTQVFETLLP